MKFIPSMRGATVNDRLTVIDQRLNAIDGALHLLDALETGGEVQGDNTIADSGTLIAAIRDDIARIYDEVVWLQNLPDVVLNRPALTEDEIAEATRDDRIAAVVPARPKRRAR